MKFKQWLEAKVQWNIPWPNRQGVGDDPHEQDTPPEMEGEDYVLYHGTNEPNAQSIMQQRRILHDNMGVVGISTTHREASVFACMKCRPKENIGPVVLRIVIKKDWLLQQEITREVGGSGKNQWLISVPEIPSEAIKTIDVYSVWGERQ